MNAVDATFDLAAGASAQIELEGAIAPTVAFVDLQVQASTPSGAVATNLVQNVSLPANGLGVLKDGFE